MDDAVDQALQGAIPVTCRRSSDDVVVVKADGGDAAAVGSVTECLSQQQERDAVQGLIYFSFSREQI